MRLRDWWLGVLDVLYPPRCAACDALGIAPLCWTCNDALEPASRFSVEGLDSCVARFEYGGPIADAIVSMKYEKRIDVGVALAELLAKGFVPACDVIVPIPLSKRRLRERGFNQADILARALLGRRDGRALDRSIDRGPQVGRDRERRGRAILGAFRARRERVLKMRVLLVDDVVTTGATLRAAARTLLEAGAREVHGLVLARTIGGEGMQRRAA